MILEKYFANLIVIIAAKDEVIKAVKMNIAICWEVIFSNKCEMTTKNPALVLFIENKAIIESIANDADVKPVKMRKVFLFNFWNEDAMAEDCEEVIAGRKPRKIEERNPDNIAIANSFLFISGKSVFCGGMVGLFLMLNIKMLTPNKPESKGSRG